MVIKAIWTCLRFLMPISPLILVSVVVLHLTGWKSLPFLPLPNGRLGKLGNLVKDRLRNMIARKKIR